jgi:hypothetical protein
MTSWATRTRRRTAIETSCGTEGGLEVEEECCFSLQSSQDCTWEAVYSGSSSFVLAPLTFGKEARRRRWALFENRSGILDASSFCRDDGGQYCGAGFVCGLVGYMGQGGYWARQCMRSVAVGGIECWIGNHGDELQMGTMPTSLDAISGRVVAIQTGCTRADW